MSDRVRVKPADEFEEGERAIVEVDGRSVGVLNVDGEYYAVLNQCAHAGGPVCEGQVKPQLEGEFVEPGKRIKKTLSEDSFRISCPWHGWDYDLESGVHLGQSDISIPTFDVTVEDGVVYVET